MRRDYPFSSLCWLSGLGASIAMMYYSRIRFHQLLLPLLDESRGPLVVSTLAGEKEGPIHVEELALIYRGDVVFEGVCSK
jgi:hypothetical protein